MSFVCLVSAAENPFKENLTSLPKPGGGEYGKFYSLPSLKDPRIGKFLALSDPKSNFIVSCDPKSNFIVLCDCMIDMIVLCLCVTDRLPYSIRILLESAIRNCDNFQVKKEDVEKIIDWEKTAPKQVEIPFKPARVLLQVIPEFTYPF